MHDDPGEAGAAGARHGIDLEARPALAWMDFPASWQELYYNGLCNGALWPLLHSMPTRMRLARADHEAYRQATEAFAAAAERLARPTASVWIHDYHLLLLGGALRARGHTGPIGVFFHVPFCGPDIFIELPWADELLRALLACDLVGFHTGGYAENFIRCAAALPGVVVEGQVLVHAGRRTVVEQPAQRRVDGDREQCAQARRSLCEVVHTGCGQVCGRTARCGPKYRSHRRVFHSGQFFAA